jgi:hypothetical protein
MLERKYQLNSRNNPNKWNFLATLQELQQLKSQEKSFSLPPTPFFYWHRLCKAFTPTNPEGAQALGKEFPASASRVIQEVIKFPLFDNPKGLNASKRC